MKRWNSVSRSQRCKFDIHCIEVSARPEHYGAAERIVQAKSEKRRTSVKQILRASFGVVFLAALAGLALVTKDGGTALPIVYAQSGCTDATLSGVYPFSFLGWATPPPKTLTEGKSSIPTAAAGLVTFDGAGNWTTSFTYSHNGDITSATSVPGGLYTVDSDCTGTMTGFANFAIIILDRGAEITGINTQDNVTSTIEARKQNASGCSNATLTGSYAVTLTGFGTPPPGLSPGNSSVPVALAGLATFDGAGNFTGSFTLSHNGDISARPSDVGAYTLNSDCTGTLTDATAGMHFATVVLNGGTELFGVQADVGTAAILDIKKQ